MSPSALDVLLVEDSPTTAELFVFSLKSIKSAATIHVVRDGVEALDLLLGGATEDESALHVLPRLVLLDLHMPRVNGFEVLQHLRANERTRRLPVVVYSSSDQESDRREVFRLGADGYIRKPAGYKDFRETVAQLERDWLRAE
ncbi:MAG: response regulator [Burkholderiales bacterium]|jgi:CheY-like chemotaxis protein|nr:response regulator [Burkholderiales bacterium]